MTEDFWTWYEKHKIELFWYKYRGTHDLDPEGKSTWLQEKRHFAKMSRQRKLCQESDDPIYAITKACDIDRQYFLQERWDELDAHDKRKALEYVWLTSGDGVLYGFDWWFPYFEETGFFTNCVHSKPNEPLMLYRGAEPPFAALMSWTDSYEMAYSFANYTGEPIMEKYVFKTVVNPESILAIFRCETGFANNEGETTLDDEYVVDFRDLNPDNIEMIE